MTFAYKKKAFVPDFAKQDIIRVVRSQSRTNEVFKKNFQNQY